MLRKQVYFAVVSFVILCAILSIAHFVFGFSLLPTTQPSSHQSYATQPVNTKPPFWFTLFLLVISVVMLVGGSYLSYLVWFQGAKVRANLERIRELAQQGQLVSLRHDYSQINSTVYLWFMRFFSPFIVLLGIILFSATLTTF